MIIGYHTIFTTYGTWLPNDPRGSFSHEIYSRALQALGPIQYGRRNPQPGRAILRRFWTAAEPKLSRRAYFIDDRTRAVVGRGFAKVVDRLGLNIFACSVMNDHVHLLIGRSKYRIEYLVGQFKGAATHALGLKQTPWTRGCWKVFINDTSALHAAGKYIEHNPVAAGLRPAAKTEGMGCGGSAPRR